MNRLFGSEKFQTRFSRFLVVENLPGFLLCLGLGDVFGLELGQQTCFGCFDELPLFRFGASQAFYFFVQPLHALGPLLRFNVQASTFIFVLDDALFGFGNPSLLLLPGKLKSFDRGGKFMFLLRPLSRGGLGLLTQNFQSRQPLAFLFSALARVEFNPAFCFFEGATLGFVFSSYLGGSNFGATPFKFGFDALEFFLFLT